MSGLNAGWSQPTVRTSAAVAASSAPPTTNPKYRGPVVATSAGSTASASSRTTSAVGVGRSGSEPRRARSSSRSTPVGNTGMSAARSRCVAALVAASTRRSRREVTCPSFPRRGRPAQGVRFRDGSRRRPHPAGGRVLTAERSARAHPVAAETGGGERQDEHRQHRRGHQCGGGGCAQASGLRPRSR